MDRLCAMQDRDDRKAGAPSKVEQFTACALRGFGAHKTTLATGTYGLGDGELFTTDGTF